MKKVLFLLSALAFLPLAAAPEASTPYLTVDEPLLEADEVETIEHLVQATEKNLEKQKELLKSLEAFKLARERFRREESKEAAADVINLACNIKELLEENHLSGLFKAEFLSEVQVISKMAQRQTLPRP